MTEISADATGGSPGADDAAAPATGPRPLATRPYALLLVVLGAVGFGGALWLAIERILKLQDPDRVTSCSINLFLDCGVAMESWQGSLLGFPNPFIGVAAFPVVITTGVVLLTGARLPRWYHLWLLGGTVLGQLLVFFLMWTSFYVLVALCPACMVVWTAMWPLLWFQVVRAVQEGDLRVGDGLRRIVVGNRGVILVIGYVVAVAWLLVAVGAALVASF
ncbi:MULTISPECIES: vitamin K epoxide reductase family protein [unclassified Isoptericola]|uniref:vitamin K epoxide reductase family protein n=1 Tax=unclassified Isoptericola TaxID=2623355 RepID=UPI00271367D7|nr:MULTISPECIES: vitamin K epoxide reductase family protein [unclassified Isoptericola]MDO8145371.1 vitamin K epoxide reductase family protein [Isoptericola sp. 178]MDO8149012.1 vitamin K epoxide reductase family protein [Isoptericola sp. b515]MDO8151048.1 vitamin K epoxide reductase family protein [Isoptericola sp. b408]